ncbi:MAG: thioesterase family protein [Pseudomonadota bacterium]
MNLWLRLIWMIITARWRPSTVPPLESSALILRVLPTDLDANLHLTNGRYLSFADLGRIDYALVSGIWRHAYRGRWAPIVTYTAASFHRELKAWQRIRLSTRIVYWDDRIQVFEHAFDCVGGRHDGQRAAVTLAVAGMYNRRKRRFVTSDELFQVLGQAPFTCPEPEPQVARFLEAYRAMRAVARARQDGAGAEEDKTAAPGREKTG